MSRGVSNPDSAAGRAAAWAEAEALSHAPVAAAWTELPGVVRHTFTHFHLVLTVWAGQADRDEAGAADGAIGTWVRLDDLAE